MRTLKHSLWLLIAWWTGGAWVLYFADAPTLVGQLATFDSLFGGQNGSLLYFAAVSVAIFVLGVVRVSRTDVSGD